MAPAATCVSGTVTAVSATPTTGSHLHCLQYPSRKKAPVQAVRSRFTGSDKTTGVLLVIGSCISLQIGAAFAVQLFPQLGAWGVTTLRLGVAALVICALTRPRFWAWNLPQWIAVALLGASFAFMNGAFYHAIELLPLGLAVSVEFIGPLVLAAVLSHRLIDGLWIGLATIGMALIGVEKAFGAEHISTQGLVFALVAGFFWACYILASSRVGKLIDGAGGPAPPWSSPHLSRYPSAGPVLPRPLPTPASLP